VTPVTNVTWELIEGVIVTPMRVVIFGGTGFLGAHYARILLQDDPKAQVVLCDRVPLDESRFAPCLVKALSDGRLTYRKVDLRQHIPDDLAEGGVDIVANFAAIHREPGHEAWEYFETNLLGAENVCKFAESAGVRQLLFMSSISPYGVSETERDESSLPVPSTPYGASKLAAEKIHLAWQRGGVDRRILIVRPGVIFGAGEGGNVTRMIRFVRKGLFVYLGNKQVRKAGVFVKELCRMCEWGLSRLEDPEFCNIRPGAAFFNASFAPPPSVEDYVKAIRAVGDYHRPVYSVPYQLLFLASHFFMGIGGIHPVRVRKLIRPNLILPTFLTELGYQWKWTLQEAMADWKAEKPDDWE
jgi:GlcNAc-P-P-Und epimerase